MLASMRRRPAVFSHPPNFLVCVLCWVALCSSWNITAVMACPVHLPPRCTRLRGRWSSTRRPSGATRMPRPSRWASRGWASRAPVPTLPCDELCGQSQARQTHATQRFLFGASVHIPSGCLRCCLLEGDVRTGGWFTMRMCSDPDMPPAWQSPIRYLDSASCAVGCMEAQRGESR